MPDRLYFDNAATSFPKPDTVHQAMLSYARDIGASAGRGAYREALESGRIISQTRSRIAQLINAPDPEHVIMTFNCTDGLVLAIKGIVTRPRCHVITSRMEHNSVLRPLSALQDQLGIEVTYIAADRRGLVDPEDFRRAVRPETALIGLVHASNVCGSLQDIAAVGRIAREAEIPYLVDAAQTAGHIPIDVQAFPIDMLAFPGHKALLGPLGTGAIYIRPGMESHLRPLKEGGTGSRSEVPVQPDFLPDRFEAGSHNTLGIAGLGAGVQYLLDKGMDVLAEHDRTLCQTFLDHTADIPHLTVHGPTDLDKRIGVFSVTIDGYAPAELSAVLEEQFGILTRPGLHCAPYAHQTIGTFELGGACRLSFGPFLTVDDISYAAAALKKITQGVHIAPSKPS